MNPNWVCVQYSAKNRPSQPVREIMNCTNCGSTWRHRATVLSINVALTGQSSPLNELSPSLDVFGIGISDHPIVADQLSAFFHYSNTFYHKAPHLDIREPSPDLTNFMNFVSCSDVQGHFPPPADRAIRGLRKMLINSCGFAIISVPNSDRNETWECYPNLLNYSTRDDGSISWTDHLGTAYVNDEPEFHAGGGQTLTFREWSLNDLNSDLIKNGFSTVTPYAQDEQLGVPEIENAGMLIAWA